MFIEIKCPSCGAVCDIDENREIAFCTFCGTKMVNESARVQIDTSPTVKNLLIRANQFKDSGDHQKSKEYYNRVLDIDAGCLEAINGIRRIDGLPVDENVFVVMAKSANFPLSVSIDDVMIGEIANHSVLFCKLSEGDHRIGGVAFGNEKCVPARFHLSCGKRIVIVANYSAAGAVFRTGSNADLPETMR